MEEKNEKPILIEMEDTDGVKVRVQIVATFEDNGKNYAIANDVDDKDSSYIFNIESTDDGDILSSIDDEKEFERLCKVVDELAEIEE